MPVEKRENALLVSERAIGADQGGRYLLTVDSKNVVEKRPIRIGQLEDGLRVIEEGLKPGDRVVVNGVQRARPGAKVDPELIEMKSLTASALRAATQGITDRSSTSKPAGDASEQSPNVDIMDAEVVKEVPQEAAKSTASSGEGNSE